MEVYGDDTKPVESGKSEGCKRNGNENLSNNSNESASEIRPKDVPNDVAEGSASEGSASPKIR